MAYSSEIIAEGRAILALPYPPLPVFNKFMKFLSNNNISYKASDLNVKHMLVHPMNRDGAMVTPHDAHENLLRIKHIGADLKKLVDAVCVELARDKETRELQISANRCMCETSGGKLAPINNTERYLSIGCSHSSVAVKAALAQCVTDVAELAVNGRMSQIQICGNDEELAHMFDIGWDWDVIPSEAAETWPDAIPLGSRALNAANSVPTLPSETSSMLCIQAFLRQGASVEVAVTRILKAAPPCAHYINAIKDVALMFNTDKDDEDALIKLNRYASHHGGTLKLGEDFLNAIATIRFMDAKPRSLTRLAAVYANLISPYSVHGVATLIRPAMLKKMWTVTDLVGCTAFEELYTDVLHTLALLVGKELITPAQEVMLQGRVFLRGTLLQHGIEGKAAEKTCYHNIGGIQHQFKTELTSALGKKAPKLPWEQRGTHASAPDAPTIAAAPRANDNADPIEADRDDPSYIASQQDFKVGTCCYEKAFGNGRIFKITEIDDHVALDLVRFRCLPPFSSSVELGVFLRSFVRVRDLKVVPQEITGKTPTLTCAPIMRWRHRHAVVSALIDTEASYAMDYKDFIFLNNFTIAAAKDFGPYEIRFAPVSVNLRPSREGEVTHRVTYGAAAFQMLTPDRDKNVNNFSDSIITAPFWFVTTKEMKVGMPNQCNMIVKLHKMDVNGTPITFNMLTNDRAVTAGDMLYVLNANFAPKKSVVEGIASSSASKPVAKPASKAVKAKGTNKAKAKGTKRKLSMKA
jgi:hypothetical protein